MLWDRATGRPIAPALVWQDRRTAARCAELPAELIRERTGLVPDPYFSATKLEWLLEHAGTAGELAFGTIDSWLAWKLTGEHVTDVSNASRTLLLGLDELAWDDELLALFGVPRSVLPTVVSSSGELGHAKLFGATVPLTGIAGDQQAALFGQACFAPGRAKVTYGTGAFVLANAGPERPRPADGVLATAAWRLGDAPAVYALEGSVFVAGAAIQWLRDGLGLIEDAAETESARALPRRQRRRSLRARADGSRLALLGAGGTRVDLRPDPGDAAGAPRPSGPRGDRLPDERRPDRDAAGRPAAPRRRWRRLEHVPAPVPGRRRPVAGRGASRAGGDRRSARPRSPGSVSACGRIPQSSRPAGAEPPGTSPSWRRRRLSGSSRAGTTLFGARSREALAARNGLAPLVRVTSPTEPTMRLVLERDA